MSLREIDRVRPFKAVVDRMMALVSQGNRRDIAFRPLSGVRDTATVIAVTRRGDRSNIVASLVETLVEVTAQLYAGER